MNIIISNSSEVPIYQQIKEQIKDAILYGQLAEGEQLPSIRVLASDLRVSVLTTRRVYDELEAEGFINSRAGKGSFVAAENYEMLRESKRHFVEGKLAEALAAARSLGITREELFKMMDLLFEEDET